MRGTRFALEVCAVVAVGVGACGDDPAESPSGTFEVVGHAELGARGMNAAIAVAGDTVYVGSRIDQKGIAIVDVADPAAPVMVGEIAGSMAVSMSSRELRAVAERDLLVVMNILCSPQLHGCAAGAGQSEHLALYDIRDRRAPVLAATYPIVGTNLLRRGPHEMHLHFDRAAGRVLVFVAAPGAKPGLEVVDVTDPAAPVRAATWDPRDAGLMPMGADDILHSVSISADGRRAYLSHQLSGLLVADVSALPAVSLITPPAQALDWAPPGAMGPHSAVEVPERDVLVVTEEVYPPPFGAGCPWGHLRTVSIADPAAPALAGEFRLPEQDAARCASVPAATAFTAHNVTTTRDLALVTWYAGGLVALDLADPARPAKLAELRPSPLATVAVEDPGLGGNPVEMWSYPVVQDGLIYVVDVRNGLYVLRYRGAHEEQLAADAFIEGNSNL